ncbi:LOW QUALITY PROTEIN: protein RALF-like 1 [Capsella rubella]|uniref:LOW QUALITY PROTEIN: protein RALF-like 1 n=1 Tax=Capsella rubella TaxID=81985 RepID=UPI000CD54F21|nr:LOW QUALITY PROTEIN: protein RALF-like 1 [Capsella rubella]
MAKSFTLFPTLVILILFIVIISSPQIQAGFTNDLDGLEWATSGESGGSGCHGSIAECIGAEEEEMDSEISRRVLATTKYISYQSLKKNSVPCSRRGASYYNCQNGAQANPYSRGCSKIARCRS